MNRLGTWGDRLKAPRRCELCRAWSARALCRDCLAVFLRDVPRCTCCALRLDEAAVRCADCVRRPPPFARCVAAGDYGYPWDGLIGAFKFRERLELAGLLSEALGDAVRRAGTMGVELVLPVPLSPQRLRERGHNQAWELARRVATSLGLAADARTLLRLRDTAHQVGLTREERGHNLRHAMFVEPARRAAVAGRHVALVDDVLTTGVTAATATRALLDAGACSVQVWVVARTPAPD